MNGHTINICMHVIVLIFLSSRQSKHFAMNTADEINIGVIKCDQYGHLLEWQLFKQETVFSILCILHVACRHRQKTNI